MNYFVQCTFNRVCHKDTIHYKHLLRCHVFVIHPAQTRMKCVTYVDILYIHTYIICIYVIYIYIICYIHCTQYTQWDYYSLGFVFFVNRYMVIGVSAFNNNFLIFNTFF